ncbi:MAG: polysaccharide deacetylase family protein, partial [Oscillospiraceae bacterium]|nr:polysaccharide deacetylase family protein [Oscillospiraceae bacterium]
DDGPSANTLEVLEALERHGVKATFFITGQNPEYYDMIAKEAEAGHLVAAHTYSHDFGEIYTGESGFWEDIERLQELIAAQTGSRSTVLRFAGGSSNSVGGRSLMKTLAGQCAEKGYVYFDWNVDTRDAVGDTKSADYIAERAVKGALRENVPVILMHDGPMNTTAADALDIIIPALKEQGYAFATLGELADAPVQHSLS